MRVVALFLTATFGFGGIARAQSVEHSNEYVHDHWTISDGLPVNHANWLHQSTTGYIWISTFGGLVRYDGARFTVFTAGNTPGFPSDRITTMFDGAGDGFWVASEQRDLIRVTPDGYETVNRFSREIMSIYVDGDSLTWIATRAGLYRYDERVADADKRLAPIDDEQFRGYPVRDVIRDNQGTLWVTSEEDGRVFRRSRAGFVEVGRVPMRADAGPLLFKSRDGVLWIGGHVLAQIQNGRIHVLDVAGPEGRPGFRIAAFHEDR